MSETFDFGKFERINIHEDGYGEALADVMRDYDAYRDARLRDEVARITNEYVRQIVRDECADQFAKTLAAVEGIKEYYAAALESLLKKYATTELVRNILCDEFIDHMDKVEHLGMGAIREIVRKECADIVTQFGYKRTQVEYDPLVQKVRERLGD